MIPLTVTIPCTPDPAARLGALHRVTIAGDWSVVTPHDLGAERIAESLGGWCACLHFADRVVPAFRDSYAMMIDRNPFAAFRVQRLDEIDRELGDPLDDWVILPGLGMRDVRAALRESISPARAIRRTGEADAVIEAEREQYTRLFSAAARAWAAWADPAQLVEGRGGFLSLWEHGIPPLVIDRIARELPRASWPLPARFFDRVVFDGVDRTWLSSVLNI